jgi:hypothetical protein
LSDEYEAMGRGELLTRLRDWQTTSNDRTQEILRLEQELREAEAGIADLAEEIEDGQVLVGALIDYVDNEAKVIGGNGGPATVIVPVPLIEALRMIVKHTK